ncbi:MAG: envelope stress response membrane protein PspC [Aestuariibacter sp.]
MSKRELYRDPEKGKLAGVCAGIAKYFGWELWLIRIIFISGVLLTGSFFLVAYVVAWFILEKDPGAQSDSHSGAKQFNWGSNSESEEVKVEVKSKVWQAGEPPRQAFKDITASFDRLEQRLRKVESYVTSKEFQLNREISNL